MNATRAHGSAKRLGVALCSVLAAMAMLLAAAGPVAATTGADSREVRRTVDTVLTQVALEAINLCSLPHAAAPVVIGQLIDTSGNPVKYGCTGGYDLDVTSSGASAAADLEAFVCVGTTCTVVPLRLNRTGGYVEPDVKFQSVERPLVTVPRVCVSGICVVRDPIEVTTVDPNNYLLEVFDDATDEVRVYHPFSNDPITLGIGAITIDGQPSTVLGSPL